MSWFTHKKEIYVIELTPAEFRLLIQTLIWRRNKLIEEGKPTYNVDELIIKFNKAK